MIGYLKGKILRKNPPFLLLDVNNVGYELEAPMATFYALPEQGEVSLFAHLVVREDAQLLYGFSDESQQQLFRILLKINGVGPKVALAILSTLSVEELVQCVNQNDSTTLIRVPGIGKKTAERMIIDLRDRIAAFDGAEQYSQSVPGEDPVANPSQDAIGALMALGYKQAEATRAVRAMEADHTERDDLIRSALQYLTQR